MIQLRVTSAALALVVVAAAACSRPRPVRQQSAPDPTTPAVTDAARRDTAARSERGGEGAEERAREAGSAARDPDVAVLESRIYFDFDRSDLTAEARSALAAKLSVLLANPDIRIQVVGHADERGSDEYNLALGLERAAAAKRFLTQRGVAPDRISVISMGEEQPLCSASSESCWWQNRRDEFEITSSARARRP